MSVAFHKLIIMEKCHGDCRIRFITGLFAHSSKADEPSLSSIQHCSFRQILYLLWRLHHVLVLPICIATLFTIWIHWPQASIPFLEDEFKYMKNLDPVRDSGILGFWDAAHISKHQDQTNFQPALVSHAPSI